MTDEPHPTLSIVVPLFNEEAVVPELIERCLTAGEEAVSDFELILVDDHSHDQTWEKILSAGNDARIKPLRLDSNQGQSRATKAGVMLARGQWIVVLDGDLQDPPELIPRLWSTSQEEPCNVVFATKGFGNGPWWFRMGQRIYHALQNTFGARHLPSGGGSYCLVQAPFGKNAARTSFAFVNMAAALAAQRVRWRAIPYEKQARADGDSRVGFTGLVREAIESLVITGASEKLGFLIFAFFGAGAFISRSWNNSITLLCFALSLISLLIAIPSLTTRRIQLGKMEKD